VETGLVPCFLRHTSASLLIQENADPDVLKDLANFMAKLVPESAHIHSAEGLDDMPAHIRTALTHTSEQIPIAQGQLVLGTWQGIYIWEHRQRSHPEKLLFTLWVSKQAGSREMRMKSSAQDHPCFLLLLCPFALLSRRMKGARE